MPKRAALVPLILDNSLLLIVGAVAALVWANVDAGSYERFTHPIHFAVNDVGMAFFFALAAKEVFEATLPGGPLASPRRAAVPILAAVGGMVAPAAIFLTAALQVGEPGLARGWAIPCATDIAFSHFAARVVFGKRHPAIPFLLLLAIADDAFGLIVLAVFYPVTSVSIMNLVLFLAPAVVLAWWLNRAHVRNFWPYIGLAGALSWIALWRGGLHPALALVPIVPFMPHAPREIGLFDPRKERQPDTLDRFAHWWRVPVQIILFFFGLANAGVPLTSSGAATWIVLGALIVGKPVGIVLFTGIATAAGLHRPAGIDRNDLVVLGTMAGIGFTVSLFFATAAFPESALLGEAKMGALLSFVAGPASAMVARAVGLRARR